MHSVGRDGLDLLDFRNYSLGVKDVVVLSFGEIDARAILHTRSDEGIVGEIKRLVTAYEQVIILNKIEYPSVDIWIMGLPPAVHPQRCRYCGKGSLNERLMYTLLMNYYLRLMCDRNNFIYIDFFEDYTDIDGSLVAGKSDGDHHVVHTSKTKQFIKDLIIQKRIK